MKNLKKNYRLYFNVLLVGGMALFFSSCAREKGAVSYNSEKLRKQSYEIENSKPSTGNYEVAKALKNETTVAPTEKSVNPGHRIDNKSVKNEVAIGEKMKEQKPTAVQKILIKKMTKKMNAADKQSALDKNLKLAIIFGAVALIFFILGFIPFFWIFGAIALVIAVVFLLLWVLEQ